jgi:hypothetical protein
MQLYYDTTKVEPILEDMIEKLGINVCMLSLAVDVVMENAKKIKGVVLFDDTFVEGNVFIDATGLAGSMEDCLKYGNGCSVCILRCPSFGSRISISSRAEIEDIVGMRNDNETSSLSGHNAARLVMGETLIEIPRILAIGDIIAFKEVLLGTCFYDCS